MYANANESAELDLLCGMPGLIGAQIYVALFLHIIPLPTIFQDEVVPVVCLFPHLMRQHGCRRVGADNGN